MKKFQIYKLILIPGALLSLQSCFVAKEYTPPQGVVQEEFYRTESLSQDSLNMASLSWRELFSDPLLISYIEEGLQSNMDIRVAVEQIAVSEAYVKQGKAGYLPTLSLSGSANHQAMSKNSQFATTPDGTQSQYEATGNLSWEVDIWGKIRSNDRAFRASFLQSTAAHQAVKTELISRLASSYYLLLALDEQQRITQETIATRQSSLETTKALKEAGSVTEVGVKQTEAQLYRAQAVLIDINNEIRLLENSFSLLLGYAPRQIERTTLDNQVLEIALNTGLPSQLLRNRPDVIAAEAQLINAFELTNVARSSFYPSLRLSAAGGFRSLDIAELFNANSLFSNLLASVAQPLINGRQIRTQYEVSQAQQEIALIDFERSLLNASREVSDAMYNYDAALGKIGVKTKEFDAYLLATTYSEELLNNGMVNYLEVLTARENTLNSQLELVNARFNKFNSIIELYRALGGGWR